MRVHEFREVSRVSKACSSSTPLQQLRLTSWRPASTRTVVVRAEGGSGISSIHEQLLKEIEERRRKQAQLLEKLNQLSAATATIQVDAPPAISEPEFKPYLEPDAPKTEPITSARPTAPSVLNPAQSYDAAFAALLTTPVAPPKTAPMAAPSPPPAPQPKEPLAGPNVMNVVMVGAECAPWSKTGGLGDVMSALPKALRRRGHRVMVVAPRYGNYGTDTGVRVRVQMWGQQHEVAYFHSYIDDVDFIFLDHGCFRGREKDIYGGGRTDLLFRCALLSKAALEAVWHVPCGGITYGDQNLCFIANDWHTALLPVYLQAHYRDYGQMTYARSVFVIHNMAHQGRGPFDEVNNLELNANYTGKFFLDDPVGGIHMNVLKAGLETAQRLVAVSTGYAWECKTPEGGWGLHQTLQTDAWKLSGIVNGMDYKEWSPENDEFLQSDGYANYSMQSFDQGKAACKAALQRELGLPVNPRVPLLGFIGRLDYQKGVDLIANSIEWLIQQGAQVVFLGSGREDLEESLRSMENRKRDQIRSWVGFSVKMAHRITAGCDILLMPSRFEPCGLNQLYAMAYGTVPVVHAVGGLRDTVKPYNPNDQTGTGWTFDSADAEKFRTATYYALDTYRNHAQDFRKIQLRGMAQDLSWDNAAKQYEDVLVAAKYQW